MASGQTRGSLYGTFYLTCAWFPCHEAFLFLAYHEFGFNSCDLSFTALPITLGLQTYISELRAHVGLVSTYYHNHSIRTWNKISVFPFSSRPKSRVPIAPKLLRLRGVSSAHRVSSGRGPGFDSPDLGRGESQLRPLLHRRLQRPGQVRPLGQLRLRQHLGHPENKVRSHS